MTEQQACTLCGAGGHTAAQCNWNKADGAQGEREAFERWHLETFGLVLDAGIAGACQERWGSWQARAALAQSSQAPELEFETLSVTKCSRPGCNEPCAHFYPTECERHHLATLDKRLGIKTTSPQEE